MRALVIGMALLLTACGAIERAFVDGLLEVQSRAVLTQSTFKPDHGERRHEPCDGIRNERLNRTRSKSASDTSRPVMVILSAYSSTVRSRSSKSGDSAYSLMARSFSSGMPSSLPTAALRSCQNSHPLRNPLRLGIEHGADRFVSGVRVDVRNSRHRVLRHIVV